MSTEDELNEYSEYFLRRKLMRYARGFMEGFCRTMPVEDLEYAAANSIDIVADLLKPVGKKKAQLAAIPFRNLLEKITTDHLVQMFEEVSPEHAAVLRRHRVWLERQVARARQEVLAH